LKSVQDVKDALKAHGVDGSICIAVEIIADFEDPAETLERLCVLWMIPELRFKKCLPDLAANGRRKRLQVFAAGAKMVGLIERNRSITEI
jgi:hypothetical protein